MSDIDRYFLYGTLRNSAWMSIYPGARLMGESDLSTEYLPATHSLAGWSLLAPRNLFFPVIRKAPLGVETYVVGSVVEVMGESRGPVAAWLNRVGGLGVLYDREEVGVEALDGGRTVAATAFVPTPRFAASYDYPGGHDVIPSGDWHKRREKS